MDRTCRSYLTSCTEAQRRNFVLDSSTDWKPVQSVKMRCNVVCPFNIQSMSPGLTSWLKWSTCTALVTQHLPACRLAHPQSSWKLPLYSSPCRLAWHCDRLAEIWVQVYSFNSLSLYSFDTCQHVGQLLYMYILYIFTYMYKTYIYIYSLVWIITHNCFLLINSLSCLKDVFGMLEMTGI